MFQKHIWYRHLSTICLTINLNKQNIKNYLILFEFCSNSPPLIIGQSMSVLLKQRIDTRNAPVPTVLQILQCESPVLCIGLLSLQCILSPHTLWVYELRLPWLNVSVQVGNQLIFIMTHARTEVGDTNVSLFRPPQIRLRAGNVPVIEISITLICNIKKTAWFCSYIKMHSVNQILEQACSTS